MKFLKILLASLSLTFIMGAGSASALSLGHFQAPNVKLVSSAVDQACSGVSSLTGKGCSSGSSTIPKIAKVVVDLLSTLIGIVAVIMILISAFRFITANGDSNTITSARNGLLYAIVGLVVAILAIFIASKTLNTANKIQQSSSIKYSAIRNDS